MKHNQPRARCLAKVIVIWMALLSWLPLQAAADSGQTPQELDAWTDWVLHDVKDYGCPLINSETLSRLCAWPSELELDLNATGGTFTQRWSVFRETDISLPGSDENWPRQVSIDGKPATVVKRGDMPSLRIEPGDYRIEGKFTWDNLPDSLRVSPDSGLVRLRVDGAGVPQPDIRQDQLWLRAQTQPQQESQRLELKVFRRVIDDIPLRLETRIELEVSGEQQETTLQGALLQGFSATGVESQLPARLSKEGALTLKTRPGRWVVTVLSHLLEEKLELSLASNPEPWPQSELWVFEARPHLRLLKVEAPVSIDASQTALPQQWKSLPAYRMQAGGRMVFTQIRRGDPQPEPDKLSLNRTLWLDFDGGGYTVSDQIAGTMARGMRIDADDRLQLGQVTLEGKPQLITRAGDGAIGIEVRQGVLNLSADSRIEGRVGEFPASGWRHDFDSLSMQLNTPPGYRVLAISGADRAPATWLSEWTLLDFFLVLIAAIALYKLMGLGWGLLGLLALSLLWHEPDAPKYIWLNLIAALALMRVLKQTRAFNFFRNYLLLSAAALVLLVLPFMVQQVRDAIYPQLEYPWQSMGDEGWRQPRPVASLPPPNAEMRSLDLVGSSAVLLDEAREGVVKLGAQGPVRFNTLQQDPEAKLQTGPGLPEWSWRGYQVEWNGPVQADQRLSVYILSPLLVSLSNFLRVGIILLLGWRLLYQPISEFVKRGTGKADVGNVSAAYLCLALLWGAGMLGLPTDASAAYPPQELLQELKQRLLEPPECLPDCAGIEAMKIELTPDTAVLNLTAHVMEPLALPLAIPVNDWTPASVTVDGAPARALLRDRQGMLSLYLDKGVHQIEIRGDIKHLRSLRFEFKLKPQHLFLALHGWTANGGERLLKTTTGLSFTRELGDAPQETFDTRSQIPVFAQVSRHLQLGLDWRVRTTVRLEAGSMLPMVLRIPLLPGESVLTEGLQIEAGSVLVGLSQTVRTLSWESSLPQTETLELSAPEEPSWSETWWLDVAPIWHVQWQGIPVIYHQQAEGRWNPEWQPWPGEQVRLTIGRPQGIPGQTKTIDHSLFVVTPGERATSVELQLSMRSSQGQQHVLTLPQGAELGTVSIGGKPVPIRQSGTSVTLPVTPGSQDFTLTWQQPDGIAWLYAAPQVDLGMPSINTRVQIKPGYDRWILFTGGMRQGPAVLFWGVLIVILLIAVMLGRIKGTPLKTHSWMLLGLGLTTVTPLIALLIAVWIFALYGRGRVSEPKDSNLFNAMQMGLVLLTLFAIGALFSAISFGLLGNPEMQIAGNGSARWQLNWFQDRLDSAVPQVWMISVPVLAYRILMLIWSLWMAFALVDWLKWGWSCFSNGHLWISAPKREPKSRAGADAKTTKTNQPIE